MNGEAVTQVSAAANLALYNFNAACMIEIDFLCSDEHERAVLLLYRIFSAVYRILRLCYTKTVSENGFAFRAFGR